MSVICETPAAILGLSFGLYIGAAFIGSLIFACLVIGYEHWRNKHE